MAGVSLPAGCVCVEPVVESLAGEFADQNHGVGDRAVGAVGVGHAVQGNGGLIQIALPVNAGGVDKLLIFRDPLRGLHILVQEDADGLEVDEEDAVGFGKKTGGFRRGLGAQKDSQGQQQQDCGYDPERSAGASMHEGPSEIRYHHLRPPAVGQTLAIRSHWL